MWKAWFIYHMNDTCMIWFLTAVPPGWFNTETISHLLGMHIRELPKLFLSFTGKLRLTGIVMAELDRKLWEGGLMTTRCVNSPRLRHLVSIHLGFLCHLQAVRLHAAVPRVWKTGWASPWLSCVLGKKRALPPVAELPCVRTTASSFWSTSCWSGLWQRCFNNMPFFILHA